MHLPPYILCDKRKKPWNYCRQIHIEYTADYPHPYQLFHEYLPEYLPVTSSCGRNGLENAMTIDSFYPFLPFENQHMAPTRARNMFENVRVSEANHFVLYYLPTP